MIEINGAHAFFSGIASRRLSVGAVRIPDTCVAMSGSRTHSDLRTANGYLVMVSLRQVPETTVQTCIRTPDPISLDFSLTLIGQRFFDCGPVLCCRAQVIDAKEIC